MKNKLSVMTLGLLLIAGITVVGFAGITLRGFGQASAKVVTLAEVAQAAPAQNNAAQVMGGYGGAVKLAVTVGGVFSDTLATPPAPGAGTPTPPALGQIDLSLQLTQTGNALSGYVSFDRTLVFSVEHTLGSGASALKIGPYVNGSFDGTNLTLQSEQVSLTVSGRNVQRQFRLTGKTKKSDGSQISGEYRETLWGYSSVPVTVIGTFEMQRPVYDNNATVSSNQAPLTTADNATTAVGKAVTINVLANDSDANNDPMTIASVSKPQFGTAVISGKTIIYTPNSNFSGTDTFSYVVSDGKGGSSVGSVTITITSTGAATQTPTATATSTVAVTSTPTSTPASTGGGTPTPGANVYLPLVTR